MEHRKYHWLYFVLGICIAIILASLMGCESGKTPKGRNCIGFAGMSLEGEMCEPEPPVMCCMALTPSCVSCQEGLPEDVWLEKTCGIDAISAEYYGWDEDKSEPIWLCHTIIIN